jgi:methionyl-tRNA formyltransferase
MKIVFFGSPQTAVLSLEALMKAGHDIKLAVTQPDRPSGRGRKEIPPAVKTFASDQGIPVIQPVKIRKDKHAFTSIKSVSPDLNVVAAYGQIIPSEIIYLPPYNTINVHFSLLPKYRGASPVQWALLHGERETGITVFELNEKMDEGPILSQTSVSILPGENAGELQQRLACIGAAFLADTVSRLHSLTPEPQNHAEATYAPLIKKQDGRIDWARPAMRIDRLIRAFNPWPSAFTFLNGTRIKILKGNAVDWKSTESEPLIPGKIISVSQPGITVACGDKSVFRIEQVHPENKKPMDAYAYSLGRGIQTGDRLE